MGRVEEKGCRLVHGFRLSTVSASQPTETGTTHEPTGLDLSMKLHYLKVVYIYSPDVARDLTVTHVKEPLFSVFDQVSWVTGRFRRDDSGRPYIKCNDCGTRFVESHCDLTVEEWLRKPDRSVDELLVYHEPIGPELAFSPLIFIHMTRFSCGGLAFGISWAHIMGDPFSVSHFFSLWAQAFAGEKIYCPKTSDVYRGFRDPSITGKEPDSIKRVDPVGDLWVAPSNRKMTTFSFNLKVNDTKSNFPANGDEFEILTGFIWKCIAKAKGESEPVEITIIRSDPNGLEPRVVRNSQIISSVHVDFSVADASLEEIVKSIGEAVDVRSDIDGIVDGVSDFIVYGAKLTFVDLSEVDFYDARIKGRSPESVYCNVQGIGEEGAVMILPAAAEKRIVTVTLPEEEMEKVKWELNKCGLITPLVNCE